MKKAISFLTPLLLVLASFGKTEHINYALSDSTSYVTQENTADDHVIIIHEDYSIEFDYDYGVAESYTLLHKRVQLITDKGVNGYNAVYIPISKGNDLLSYDARVITPSGNIIPLGKDVLKEGYDEDSKTTYKYFAFEGVEKGSDIEYFYYIKRSARNTLLGRRIGFQKRSTVKNSSFEVITPDYIELDFKTYNDLGVVTRDTSLEDKNRWYLNKKDIPKFVAQSNAFKEANQQYLIFKQAGNTKTGVKNIVNYEDVASILFTNTFASANKNVLKQIKKISKELPLKSKTDEEKVRVLENYIKSNYGFMEAGNPELSDLESILANKTVNEEGAVRLFGAFLSYLEIDAQLVVTSDRSELPFDKTFESYIFLTHRLFYFAKLDLYLEPFSPLARLGYVDPMFMNTYGLFVRGAIDKKELVVSQNIGFIRPLKANQTTSDIYVDVTFDEEFNDPTYHVKHQQTGYYANTYQCGYDFIKDEAKLKMWKELGITFLDENGVVSNLDIKNKGCDQFGVNPYIVEGDLKSDKFLDFAGNKYLFKVGDLIGPQMELYQEEKRVLPVQSDYRRTYHREIKFTIPEGYAVSNLEDININKLHKNDDGGIDMEFKSTYKVEGKTVTIVIDEYYNTMDFEVSAFETYQTVINAAADFNKVVLIVQPE